MDDCTAKQIGSGAADLNRPSDNGLITHSCTANRSRNRSDEKYPSRSDPLQASLHVRPPLPLRPARLLATVAHIIRNVGLLVVIPCGSTYRENSRAYHTWRPSLRQTACFHAPKTPPV